MRLTDLLNGFVNLAAGSPVLLLATLLGIGAALGSVKIRGIGLGPAAVLFAALAFSATDSRLALPPVIGTFGLSIFAYTVGLTAGPTFFRAMRTGGQALVMVIGALCVAAGVVVAVGKAVGLSGPLLAGVYAGALTNTPALAAASEQLNSKEPTVGYSVTYLFGVLGMIAASAIAARRKGAIDNNATAALIGQTVRVDTPDLPDLATLAEQYSGRIVFSRLMRGDSPGHPGRVEVATDDIRPATGDILTVIGDPDEVTEVVARIGHPSTVALTLDRSALDSRRITVSSRIVEGHTLSSLRLERRFGATATRVRRGGIDLLGTEDLILAPGDRVRVVAPYGRMDEVAELLGDSERGAGDLNPLGLGLGLTLGLLLGALVWPLPGGATFALGTAGGPLVVGLLLGRLMRSGPIVWSLPHQVGSTLGQLGMLMFLGFAGSNSGGALIGALRTDAGPRLFAVGLVVTTSVAGISLLLGSQLVKLTGPTLAGIIAGTGTQPAVLAHANDATNGDPQVNLGYALVYPAAMIVKVILAPLVGTWG